jgi:hypothetical protein
MGKQYSVRFSSAPLGLQLDTVDGEHYVAALVAGCAAAETKLIRAGDRLVHVNGTAVSKLEHDAVIGVIVAANKDIATAASAAFTFERTGKPVPTTASAPASKKKMATQGGGETKEEDGSGWQTGKVDTSLKILCSAIALRGVWVVMFMYSDPQWLVSRIILFFHSPAVP